LGWVWTVKPARFFAPALLARLNASRVLKSPWYAVTEKPFFYLLVEATSVPFAGAAFGHAPCIDQRAGIVSRGARKESQMFVKPSAANGLATARVHRARGARVALARGRGRLGILA